MELVSLPVERLERSPSELSGGQLQRLAIARALILNPDFIVADEPVSALDVSVQAQILNLIMDLRRQLRMTMLFISHEMTVVEHICDRVAVMYAGRIVEVAPTEELFEHPLHPYTKLLLASTPVPDPDCRVTPPPAGEVADAGALPPGCAFGPRCSACVEACAGSVPELREVAPGHWAACGRI